MKRIPVRRIGVAVLLAAGFLASSAASHEQASRHKQCSLRTLEGFYLFAYIGYQIVDGQQVPFVFSGRDRVNGDGTLAASTRSASTAPSRRTSPIPVPIR